MAIIGIDLGTTNSLAAYWKDGKAELIPQGRMGEMLPSVVGFDEDGSIFVGDIAKERKITHSSDTFSSFKCFMGTEKIYDVMGKSYTPVDFSAMVLTQIKNNAEAYFGEAIEEAIISVPAYFNDQQRSDTKKAAKIAGLKVERLINEPSAAALAYRMKQPEKPRIFLCLILVEELWICHWWNALTILLRLLRLWGITTWGEIILIRLSPDIGATKISLLMRHFLIRQEVS